MMNNSTNRIVWIDCLKLFAIFLVVWGHTMHNFGWEKDQYFTGMDGWIYSFHMPLFMILSGFFSHKLLDGKFEWKKRFINLIIPWITFELFCLALGVYKNFWFLPCLFICYLIVGLYFLIKVNRNIAILKFIIFLIGCFIVFPLIKRIPYIGAFKIDFMLPCFALGILVRKYLDWILEHYIIIFLCSLILFIICSLFWTKDCTWYSTTPNWIDYKELIVNHKWVFDPQSLEKNIYRYMIGFAGSITFFCIFYGLSKLQLCNLYMNKIGSWGSYTLPVYLFHAFLVGDNWHLGMTFPTENNILYCLFYTPIVAIIVVAACIFVAYWLMKNKYIAFVLFGKLLTHK